MNEHKNDEIRQTINKFTPQKKNKVRNPFDKVLIENLHQPVCSPGMCKIYENKTNGTFSWDIEQACSIKPADIVVCNSQYEASPDPVLEKVAEEAIEKFFSQELIVPSPMESSKKLLSLIPKKTLESSPGENSMVKKFEVPKNSRSTSAQTTLTLPPILPPELEKLLQPFCTFSQEAAILDDLEVTENGSFRVETYYEFTEHFDSEQTDDEIEVEKRPPSDYKEHSPVQCSPDLSQNLVQKGMTRTFGTPIQKDPRLLRNKAFSVNELTPIQFNTPSGKDTTDGSSSTSIASLSLSPVKNSDEEQFNQKNLDSPEASMATCLDCVNSMTESARDIECFCKTPNKSILSRSTSLKDSPFKRNSLFSGKRSASMSSLNRSRSVQKLDFSMDMSVDGSTNNISQGSESNTPEKKFVTWSLSNYTNVHVKDSFRDIQSSTKINLNILDETPVKGKRRFNVGHEISKIRDSAMSPLNMSLDNSIENIDIPLSMEEKQIDFNTVDLKFLTENVKTENANSKSDASNFKRFDSGFNENTFYASSYYESAIKPSELTIPKTNKTVLKEISNVNWMRVDSGFKDDTDCTQFYPNESSKKVAFNFSNVKFDDKENVSNDTDRIIRGNKNDPMSISDFFNEDLTFTCNFSSTPSVSRKNS